MASGEDPSSSRPPVVLPDLVEPTSSKAQSSAAHTYLSQMYPDEPIPADTPQFIPVTPAPDEYLCVLVPPSPHAIIPHARLEAPVATPPAPYFCIKRDKVGWLEPMGLTPEEDHLCTVVSDKIKALLNVQANNNLYGPTVVQTYYRPYGVLSDGTLYSIKGLRLWTPKFKRHCLQKIQEAPHNPQFLSYVGYLAALFLAFNDKQSRRLIWTRVADVYRTLCLMPL